MRVLPLLHLGLLIPLLGLTPSCAEETTPEEPRIDLSVIPPKLNLAEIRNCQQDEAVNEATVQASLFGVSANKAQVLFSIALDAMATQYPDEKDRGAGGFKLATGTAGEDLQDPIQGQVNPEENTAAVLFKCTKEGRVGIQAIETSTSKVSEVKWVVCEDRDPNTFTFTLTAQDASTKLGETNPLSLDVDDGHGGNFVKGVGVVFRAEGGGTFQPDGTNEARRYLKVDTARGKGVLATDIAFACPNEEGQMPVQVEWLQQESYCDAFAKKYITCTKGDVFNTIVVNATNTSLEAASAARPNPRKNQTQVLLTVYGPQAAEPSREIALHTDLGGFIIEPTDRPRDDINLTTDADGHASVTFVGGSQPGVATLTAKTTLVARPPEDPNQQALYGPGGIPVEQQDPPPQIKIIGATSVAYVDASPDVLGVRSSGFNESSRVRFQVMGSDGNPFPAGLRVNFALVSQAGGASLAQGSAETDSMGFVQTNLNSGTIATNVTIRATVEQNGISSDSPAIPIIGVRPSWGGFQVKCDLKNVDAYCDTDGLNSRVNSPITCRAKLIDRYTNPVGLATAVSFRTEAGNISAAVTSTPQTFGSSMGPSSNVGDVVAIFNTFGVLPKDVERAGDAEPVLDENNRSINPRDGFVSVIAFVAGEEKFVDENGDGEYQEGEMFTDLAEPFVDENDNGRRDPDEPFIDLPDTSGNYDGAWSEGNSKWDRTTTIWAETRILYTGSVMVSPLHPDETGHPLVCEPAGGHWFSLNPKSPNCLMFAQIVDKRGNVPHSAVTYQATLDGGLTLVRQSASDRGDQWGIDWVRNEDCPGGPICSYRSRIQGYGEWRPEVDPASIYSRSRRMGHIMWVELAHPGTNDPYTPYNPAIYESIMNTLSFTATNDGACKEEITVSIPGEMRVSPAEK